MSSFRPMPKVPRWSREVIISEKLDGSNSSVHIYPGDHVFDTDDDGLNCLFWTDDHYFRMASRNQWITPEKDNYGFARWAVNHAAELVEGLGVGSHFGEWWGQGIQRNYGLKEKRFSLFNVSRWKTNYRLVGPTEAYIRRDLLDNDKQQYAPNCCDVVPVLYKGPMDDLQIDEIMDVLGDYGSSAAPGWMKPEGIMIYHTAANQIWKKTFIDDEGGKEQTKREKRNLTGQPWLSDPNSYKGGNRNETL